MHRHAHILCDFFFIFQNERESFFRQESFCQLLKMLLHLVSVVVIVDSSSAHSFPLFPTTSHKTLPFLVEVAAAAAVVVVAAAVALIMYLVDVHIFTATTTVLLDYLISVCVCARLCAKSFFYSRCSFFCSMLAHYLPFSLSLSLFLSLVLSLFFSHSVSSTFPICIRLILLPARSPLNAFFFFPYLFHSFTWFSLNHFGDCHRNLTLARLLSRSLARSPHLRECEFIEYI